MNASFEDVVELDAVLDANESQWETVFSEYQSVRKKDTDAIADLAIDNFHEMKAHVANPIFKQKRKLEMALEQVFPEQYTSKYALVTFNADVGYRHAMLKGRAQDKAILNLIANGTIASNFKATKEALAPILEQINSSTQNILESDRIAGLS